MCFILSSDLSPGTVTQSCLVCLVVKVSASRAEDAGFDSSLHQDFSGSSHTSDLEIGAPVASLPYLDCGCCICFVLFVSIFPKHSYSERWSNLSVGVCGCYVVGLQVYSPSIPFQSEMVKLNDRNGLWLSCPILLIHISILWIYVMSGVRQVGEPSCMEKL